MSASAIVFMVLADVSYRVILFGAVVTTAQATISDVRARRMSVGLVKRDPSLMRSPAVGGALAEAAAGLDMPISRLFPRYVSSRSDPTFRRAFAASAMHTRDGSVVFLGESFIERAREAEKRSSTPGERRYAYDELRAVLGHELAHLTQGTGASSRVLAIPYRFSTDFPLITFWVAVAIKDWRHALAGGCVALFLTWLPRKIKRLKPVCRGIHLSLGVLFMLWNRVNPFLLAIAVLWAICRLVPSMAIQRRIESACDEVAVSSGADPSALARFLQRFEPKRTRWTRDPTMWQVLQSSHPQLHKRIVDLDSR